ncbi:Mg2+ transporter protein, CorA-like/Zinc transport protein ZntB [Fusarium austroafricanum]|uniref:Mg2+ transporter protein, CorA-like/Zinc transport protein ZntB n=1 Tax=Fusarium austroafricanum TaxID=2364996 RepID=A0A8H4KJL4_9HYPO|nr:Mg2+ transporter protein, CorA-like/Zinc transport protein ZntB [Fusarium austroafricanum]
MSTASGEQHPSDEPTSTSQAGRSASLSQENPPVQDETPSGSTESTHEAPPLHQNNSLQQEHAQVQHVSVQDDVNRSYEAEDALPVAAPVPPGAPETSEAGDDPTNAPALPNEEPVEIEITPPNVPALLNAGVDQTPATQTPQTPQPRNSPLAHHPVDHFRFSLASRGQSATPVVGSTIGSLLDQVSPDPPKISGLEIFFLPPIYAEDEATRTSTLSADPEIRKELTDHLRLDPLFLTEEAWNSNGFLMSQQDWSLSPSKDAYSYMTRFLIKFLQDPDYQEETPDYSWLFLAFSILWLKTSENKVSCVLVCYDDSSKIKDCIVEGFKDYPTENIKESPFAIYDALLRVITMQYDTALWLFRKPIRDIEKGRKGFADKIPDLMNQKLEDGNGVMATYIRMHELSRHAIHMSETLQVATKTVNSTLRHVDSHVNILPHQSSEARAMNTIAGLQFSAGLLANLKLRADAFVDRLENEIRLAYNIVSVYQLQDTQRLLQEFREEEKDLITVVGQLTLIFLPATFVTVSLTKNASHVTGV